MNDLRNGTFHVRLTRYHRSKSGDDTSWRTKWETETDVQEYASSNSRSGVAADGGVEVPTSFDLPADAYSMTQKGEVFSAHIFSLNSNNWKRSLHPMIVVVKIHPAQNYSPFPCVAIAEILRGFLAKNRRSAPPALFLDLTSGDSRPGIQYT